MLPECIYMSLGTVVSISSILSMKVRLDVYHKIKKNNTTPMHVKIEADELTKDVYFLILVSFYIQIRPNVKRLNEMKKKHVAIESRGK